MDKKRIVEKGLRLFHETSIYDRAVYHQVIRSMFNLSTHYDMAPKIELYVHSARLYTYERGICIYEYRTTDEEEVIYSVLSTVISVIANQQIMEQYSDKDGRLLYSKKVTNQMDQIVTDAFYSIGGNYIQWYSEGRTFLTMQR